MKAGKYGYIEFIDRRKLKHDGWDDEIEPEVRKPTPAEREEIILNLIRDNNGKAIRVSGIASALAVTDRTVQKHLRNLEDKGLIKRIKRGNTLNRQRANILKYTGSDAPRPEGALTLAKLYAPDNPCGVRDWDWEEYKFIPGYYASRQEREGVKAMYEELKNKKKAIAEKKERLKKNDRD